MAEPTVVRYRADRPDAYAQALLRLLEVARTSNDAFRFGPTRLAACVRDGLTVQGPDLQRALVALAAVPGLAQVEH